MSLASMNPFSKKDADVSDAPGGFTSGATTALAKTTVGAKNAFTTVGHTTKSAVTKTGDSIAGLFGRGKTSVDGQVVADDDPLSLANKPDSIGSEVFVANGQLWESTGNFPKAMEAYNKALETDPKDAAALASIARLHFRQDNHTEAAKAFHQAIQQNPEDAGLYNDLGLTLSRLGQHGPAAQTIGRALQLAPGTSRYVNNLASVQFESGDTASAMKTLQDANQPAVAHFNMAYLHYRKGQADAAKAQLNMALKYEAESAGDTTIKRAVERSREMLAQIDRSSNPTLPAGTTPAVGLPGTAVPGASQPSTAVAEAAPGASDAEARIASTPNVQTRSYTMPGSTGTSATPASAVLPSWQYSAPGGGAETSAVQPTGGTTDGFKLPPGFGN